jgi:two-component system sensor histidine kinase RpfC
VLTRPDPAGTLNLQPLAMAMSSAADDAGLAGLIGTVARWHGRIVDEFAEDEAQPMVLSRRLSILVADDNALNRQVVSRMFMIDGHETVLAETGDEALQHLLDGAVEIAFLDVNMPGMSGIEVAQAYRTGVGSAATIPMVALTADFSQETRQACLRAGMLDVLVKPVGLELLRKTLGRFVLDHRIEHQPAPAEAEAPIADLERIASLRELFGFEGFESHFLASFERDLSSSLAKTAQAVREHSPQAVREALHSIKSSASTAGARRIIEQVESFQKAGAPAAELAAFEGRIKAAFQQYRATVRTDPGIDDAGDIYPNPTPLRIGKA